MNNLILVIVVLSLTAFGCFPKYSESGKDIGYKLNSPDESTVLPETLHEISGLTYIDSAKFACIQDENGILFIYNSEQNAISEQYTFTFDGDYEGIARVGSKIFILRSDGVLFEISDYKSRNFQLREFQTGIPADNNEGLCYDSENNRLLIACKSKIGKGSEFKDRRVIYGFDLQTKTLTSEPVFDINMKIIKQFAAFKKIKLPKRLAKKGLFKETEIIGHLSLSQYLFIFNMNGQIEHIELLNPRVFNKAEGISFFENGDMLITNEGQDEKPSLLRFNYLK